jgi:hypothetical protein
MLTRLVMVIGVTIAALLASFTYSAQCSIQCFKGYCWGTGVDDEDCVYFEQYQAYDLFYASANEGSRSPFGSCVAYESYTCTVVCQNAGAGQNQEMGACSPDVEIGQQSCYTCSSIGSGNGPP